MSSKGESANKPAKRTKRSDMRSSKKNKKRWMSAALHPKLIGKRDNPPIIRRVSLTPKPQLSANNNIMTKKTSQEMLKSSMLTKIDFWSKNAQKKNFWKLRNWKKKKWWRKKLLKSTKRVCKSSSRDRSALSSRDYRSHWKIRLLSNRNSSTLWPQDWRDPLHFRADQGPPEIRA